MRMSEYRVSDYLAEHQGNLFIISGPSGVGKGSINRAVAAHNDWVHLSISYTTRAMRPSEEEGKDYFFVSPDQFDRMVTEGAFLEYAIVHDGSYGTPLLLIEQKLSAGYTVILEIDVQGAVQVLRHRPDAVSIFLLPPSMEVLEQRLRVRGQNSEESIRRRLETAYQEIQECYKYDYVVINDVLDESIDRVRAIMLAERCRVKKQK